MALVKTLGCVWLTEWCAHNDDMCVKIKDSGIKIVSLSLDGSNKEVHDDFRGVNGALIGVIKAAKLFNKYNISLS